MKAQFASLSDFLAMGGHPGFVFGAWGLTALVILGLVVRAVRTGQQAKTRLTAAERKPEV